MEMVVVVAILKRLRVPFLARSPLVSNNVLTLMFMSSLGSSTSEVPMVADDDFFWKIYHCSF